MRKTYYIVTAKSAFARPHSYVCKDEEEMKRTREELRDQQYLVEVEPVEEGDLTAEQRAEISDSEN